MLPRLSIIIVDRNDREPLESTLASVLQNRPDDCEILVVHDGSYDDPYDLADEVRFVATLSKRSFLSALNAGVEAAQAEVVHLVACGLEVEEAWTDDALTHFDDATVASVTPVVLDADVRSKVVSAGVSVTLTSRRRLCGRGAKYRVTKLLKTRCIGPTLAAAFFRKSAIIELGGFPKAVGEQLADIDLALSLRAVGLQTVIEPESRLYGQPDESDRVAGFASGRQAERLVWRHAPSLGWKKALATRPLVWAAQTLACVAKPKTISRLLGRVIACCEIWHYRRHYRKLQRCNGPQSVADAKLPESMRLDAAHSSGKSRTDPSTKGARN